MVQMLMSLSFHKVTRQNNSGYQIITGETKPSVDSNNAKSSFVRVGENQWYYYDQYGQKVKGEKVIDGRLITSLKMVFKLVTHLLKVAMATLITTIKWCGKAINGFTILQVIVDVRYFDCYGPMATGLLEMGSTTFYFDTQTGIKLETNLFASQMAVSVTSSLILVIWL